ncbi:MAG TPA: hypothetical protein VMU17_07655, partial [Elusimicrobiota bacterium]|nr:hypothetical protein [Elusimicrobiota bacterium]
MHEKLLFGTQFSGPNADTLPETISVKIQNTDKVLIFRSARSLISLRRVNCSFVSTLDIGALVGAVFYRMVLEHSKAGTELRWEEHVYCEWDYDTALNECGIGKLYLRGVLGIWRDTLAWKRD